MENKDNKILELETKRHSLSHVLAAAVKELFGENVKFGIGPAIDNGCYYDFDLDESIGQEDYAKIEKKMQEIIASNLNFERVEVSKAEALKMFKNQPYKLELISELEDGTISIYKLGDIFVDLCRGPHVENTKFLRSMAFKINRASGAYWRGNEKNKMMQRVYLFAFNSKD